ncbi:helix-turn-helix domain-containing protein [Streptacidiphilus fuscans]|uniref:Helix-turn-helix domain-containing protein n=1 Tax=Streptacidiphilus fuscans TaxID=2789292 RepID=A0A931B398_9ACTN|nr:helix-turn-helix domain-containing protein [Streptacidiphilus fuscans]MBF9068176.1 helix-turn-helix domain-containing protein [Streptacidiphilus fuscans]
MTTATPEALTVPEVMAALKVGRSTVYDLIRTRQLASFTIGRCRRIATDSLAAYMRHRITEEN